MTEAPAPTRRLSDRQRLAWLRLIRADNVGPASFRELIQRYGSAEAAIDALPELAGRAGKRSIRIPSLAEAERELDHILAIGARLVALGEADYPPLLRHVDHPPPLLSILGDPTVFARPTVAIVGARNASVAGMKMAGLLARELSGEGLAIASGLARGIDAAAHRASLRNGTIAVLAGGLDKPYPPENVQLAEEIAGSGGALVTEMPMGWSPRAIDFPRRNRIIAGLSYGLIVVEAAQRSGSLISARMAGEMGRLVFAVPGSPFDQRADGPNRLLKDGATLVTEAGDVLRALAPLTGGNMPAQAPLPLQLPSQMDEVQPLSQPAPGDGQALVLECLSPVPAPLDDVIRHTGLSAAEVQLVLFELDLAGRIERHPGNMVALSG